MPHGWRISRLRDVHLVRDTPDEIAYHACISVAFIVETIKIARRVAAQPARRTLTSPQPSPAGRGRLKRATGARTIGASRMTADAEATTAADQPARHRRRASPETLRLYAADWAAFEDWCRGAGAGHAAGRSYDGGG